MPKRLTDAQVAQYRRDGYTFPVDVFSAAEVAAFRRRLDGIEAAQGRPLYGYQKQKTYLLFRWAHDAVTHPNMLDAVEDLIGPDIMVFNFSTWIKQPESPGMVSWHQDSTYFGLEPGEQVTAWFALSPATPESGCMRVLPGSHRLGQVPARVNAVPDNNLLSSGQLVEVPVDEAATVEMPLAPGQASFHHTYLIHGSNPNRSAEPRIGFSISYIPTHVRQFGERRSTALLVRGVDAYGNFDPETAPPAADCDAAATATHEACVIRYRENAKEKGNVSAARKGARLDAAPDTRL